MLRKFQPVVFEGKQAITHFTLLIELSTQLDVGTLSIRHNKTPWPKLIASGSVSYRIITQICRLFFPVKDVGPLPVSFQLWGQLFYYRAVPLPLALCSDSVRDNNVSLRWRSRTPHGGWNTADNRDKIEIWCKIWRMSFGDAPMISMANICVSAVSARHRASSETVRSI